MNWDNDIEDIGCKEIKRPYRNSQGFKIIFGVDCGFWAITPALNINLHSNTFEFEWLCFSIYIDKI